MSKLSLKTWASGALASVMLLSAPTAVLPDRLPWYEQDWNVTGTGGAAATEHPLSTQAAMEILAMGGNAVEAAIAASAMQGVVRPFSGGIGGGGYMHIYLEDEDRFVVLDHRDVAQSSFGPNAFLDGEGNEYDNSVRDNSGMAVGVPGTVKAWEEALALYGSGLTLEDVLQPAIDVAENGFYADANLIREITENADRFRGFQSTIDLYLNPDGSVPAVGTLMKNQDLADTYRLIADEGSAVFYTGEIAEAIVDTVNTPPAVATPPILIHPGSMTLSDMANYSTATYDALHTTYRGYDIYGAPPSSAGGTTIGLALNVLEGYDMDTLPRDEALHYYLEASRHAFADRNEYLGDPLTFTGPMPVTGLLSSGYAEQVRQRITEWGSGRQVEPGDPWPFDANPGLWQDPLPSRGKEAFAFDFANAADGSWDATSEFVTQVGTGSTLPGVGAEIDIANGVGDIQLSGTQYAYARAAADMSPVYDSELLVRFKIDELGGDRNLRFWLRADEWNSTTAPHNGYAVEIKTGEDNVRVLRTRDGNAVYGLTQFAHERTTDWQWLRFRVEGNQLKVRLWNDGEPEPRQSWTHTLQNSQVSAPGSFKLSALELTGAAQGGGFQISDIDVRDLNPVAFATEFTGMADGASWEANGQFVTGFGIGSSRPNEGAVIEVQDEKGYIHLAPNRYTYARAKANMNPVYDSELLVKFKMDQLGDDRNLRFWLRADEWNSTSSPHNGYGVEFNTSSDTIRIVRTRNSNGIFGLTTLDHPRTTNWQWLRLRVEGAGIKVKVWPDGSAEPPHWLHQRNNSDVTAPGQFMVSAAELTGGTTGGSFQIDDLKVYDLDALGNRESTIHLTVSDADGNIVAYTNTINSIGGNAMVVPGYGFLLNNGLNSRVPSSSPEGHPNAPRPGMRSLSSMSPTIVMKNGDPVMALGSPGGGTITTSVLQILVNYIDFGMSLPDAVDAPRLSQRNHSGTGRTLAESEFTLTPEYDLLQNRGQYFDISGLDYGIGAVNAIGFLPGGQVQAVSERVRRGGGSAMVESVYQSSTSSSSFQTEEP